MFGKKKKKPFSETDAIVVKENSISHKVEGYNRLKDNILYLNADGKNKVIQVESSISHEGKTTVACNLAVSLGLTDKKVIVVDLDFRRPRVQQRLGVSIDNGISEFIVGGLEKKDIIKETKYKNVHVITRGGKIYNSSLVLISEKFKALIAELREEYDYVILDCAPVLQISDYIHICQVSDGILFLVAYGLITRGQVAEAVKEIRKNGGKILGTVFSMYDRKKDKEYYGTKGYYGKGYSNYYRSYYYADENDSATDKDISDVDIKFSEDMESQNLIDQILEDVDVKDVE